MSRGPGRFQQAILEVLGDQPLSQMWWPKLKQCFPVEVQDKRFFRAVRGLRRMGRVEFYDQHGLRYLVRKPYYKKGEKIAVADEDLRQLLAMSVRSPQQQALDLAAQAREWEELMEEMFGGESRAPVGAYPRKTRNTA